MTASEERLRTYFPAKITAQASQSNITKGASEATRKTRLYLGAVLPLTRIIYHALGRKELPDPWDKPNEAIIGSKSAPGSRPPKTKKPTTPKKETMGKPTTRSNTAQSKNEAAKEKAQ